jgi:RND family efflux transporter MFP subunit
MDQVKVVINVIEKDLPKIKKGQSAEIQVDAYPGKNFSGKVSLVNPVLDPQTRSAQVEITLSNPRHLLKPGMFAEVKIIERIEKDAILIPRYALLEASSTSKVFLVKGEIAVEREVEVGAKGTGRIEILQGLSPGDTLVVSGHHTIENGDSIRIVKGVIE